MIGSKSLRIRFDKIHKSLKVYDRYKYLTLFGSEKYDAIYDRNRYITRVKSGITYVFPLNYAKIKVDSYDSLPLEETLILHKIIIHMKSVLNKDLSHHCYNIFSEKGLYQLTKK